MGNIECPTCGVVFGLPDFYEKKRREDHAGFYCPNGHRNFFKQQSEAEKYKALYEKEASKLLPLREQLASEQRAHERTSKKLKRTEKRAAAGVCPCCNRTFSQLAQHMNTQHKDFMQLQGLTPRKQLRSGQEKVQ